MKQKPPPFEVYKKMNIFYNLIGLAFNDMLLVEKVKTYAGFKLYFRRTMNLSLCLEKPLYK